MKYYDLFISYSVRDTRYAQQIAREAEQKGLSTFLAEKELRPGDIWSEAIREALLNSGELCVLITHDSLKSEWVLSEWSGAWLLRKTFTPILKDVQINDLPERLRVIQSADYYRIDEFIEEINRRKLNDPKLIFNEFRSNKLIKETLVAPVMAGSPFNIASSFNLARNRVFVSGQNLYGVIVRSGVANKEMIFDFLKDGADRRVDIMVCDPQFREGVATWEIITASVNYLRDLEQSIAQLKIWVSEAKRMGLNFEARIAPMVPTSITFVDPEDEFGKLFLTPNVYQNNPAERSCFFLHRALHGEAFMYYWSNYELNYNRATPIEG